MQHSETPLTYASDKGYAAIAEVIIQKTPKEKREALLNYQKKVVNKYRDLYNLNSHFIFRNI